MKNSLFLLILLFSVVPVAAQNKASWEDYLEYICESSEQSAISFQDAYSLLTELASQPLDVNTAETEDFLQIPGLDINQISDIIEYREKYGNLKDIHELSLIPSIDDRLRDYLFSFLYVAEVEPRKWYSRESLKYGLRHLTHRILLTGSFPTYAKDVTYLGDNTKHSLRYSVGMGENVKFNFTGGKSVGEPFFTQNNRWGYDSYTYNLSIRKLGIFKQIILGTFRGQFGMGLTMNNTYTLSKQNMLSAIGRISSVFSPYSGTSDEKYFQGGAVALQLPCNLSISAFVSYRNADATLNADNSMSTIITTGYHRTKNEIEKKNNISIFTTGAHVRYCKTVGGDFDWSVGTSVVYTKFSNLLNPIFTKKNTLPTSQLYRYYYPSGNSTYNIGVDYRLRWRSLSFIGETAYSGRADNTRYGKSKSDGTPIATLNSLIWRANGKITLSAVQRYYSYRYQTFYGKAFGENSNVTNESGIYGGLHYELSRNLTLDFYTDYAYFAWYRYHHGPGTYSWDNCIQATVDMGKNWTLSTRYRYKTKDDDSHKIRVIANYAGTRWQLRSHIEGSIVKKTKERSNGIIVSGSAGYKMSERWNIYGMGAFFNTDGYDSRMYAYEKGLMYNSSYPSYWGRGIHSALMVKGLLTKWLTATGKVSTTYTSATSTKKSTTKTLIEAQLQIVL